MYKLTTIVVIVLLFYYYDIVRYIKINTFPLMEIKNYAKIPRVKVNTKVIVCFTTTPKRLDKCKYTIESLLLQTVRVDEIRIHVGYYELPEWLKMLERQLPEFKIVKCKDWGPATKLIPVLLDNSIPKNSRIIYVDDDMVYNRDMIEKLVSNNIMYPNYAICNRGWDIGKYPNIINNLLWILGCNKILKTNKLYVDVIQGFSGVIVRPSFFDANEIIKYDKYPKESYYVDDVYISGILNDRNIKRISLASHSCIPYIREILNEMFLTPTSLSSIHNSDQKNDTIVANFFKWNKQI